MVGQQNAVEIFRNELISTIFPYSQYPIPEVRKKMSCWELFKKALFHTAVQVIPPLRRESTHTIILSGNLDNLKNWLHPAAADPRQKTALLAERVNSQVTPLRIRPLHVAAMTGQTAMTQALLETGVADVNARDRRGFTALHWAAAAGDHAAIQLLLSAQARQDYLNHRNGTYQDLLRLSQLPTEETALKQKVSFIDAHGKVIQGNGKDFQQKIGAVFLDQENYFLPEALMEDWMQNPNGAGDVLISKEEYKAFKAKAPVPLALYQNARGGWGVKAVAAIPQGELVLEFFGEAGPRDRGTHSFYVCEDPVTKKVFLQKNKDSSYNGIDAARYRGIAEMIEDSLPNLLVCSVEDCAGLPSRVLFRSSRNIEAGEPLSVSHDESLSERLGIHSETNREKLLTYFRENKTTIMFYNHQQAVSFVQRNSNDFKKAVKVLHESNCIHHLLVTPAVIVSCIVEKVFTFQELEHLYEEYSKNYPQTFFRFIGEEFLKSLKKFVEDSAQKDQAHSLLKALVVNLNVLQLKIYLDKNERGEITQLDCDKELLRLWYRFNNQQVAPSEKIHPDRLTDPPEREQAEEKKEN